MGVAAEGLRPWGMISRRRFFVGALLLLCSGIVGSLATLRRWAPCGDASDSGQCADLASLAVLPLDWYFAMWGSADLLLAIGLLLISIHHVHRVLLGMLVVSIGVCGLFTMLFGLGVGSLLTPVTESLVILWALVAPLLALIAAIAMGNVWELKGNMWALILLGLLVLCSGFSEYVLLQVIFASVDTPRGSDGLRYLFLVPLAVVMLVVGVLNLSGGRLAQDKVAN